MKLEEVLKQARALTQHPEGVGLFVTEQDGAWTVAVSDGSERYGGVRNLTGTAPSIDDACFQLSRALYEVARERIERYRQFYVESKQRLEQVEALLRAFER